MTTSWFQRLKSAYQVKKDRDGITQEHMAQHMGVSQSTIANWIAGRRQPVGLDEYRKIAEYLEVDPIWLMSGEQESRPARSAPLLDPSQIASWVQGKKVYTNDCKTFNIELDTADTRLYAIKATDDGMEPRVCVNDTVFLSPSIAPAPGKLIALDFRNDGYLTIGRLITSGRNYALALHADKIELTVKELKDAYRGTVLAVLMDV